jgi:DNA-binding GntR family transcriptional regulator
MSSASEVTPLRRSSVVDELADALRARILSGDLASGSALREAELSAAYDVSRHTFRAALRALAAEGLVTIVANRGATVARLERDDLRPLFELRTALELEACRLTLGHNGGTLPPTVHQALASLTGTCTSPGADWRDVAQAHTCFHEAIVAESRSPRIGEAYRRLATELDLFLAQLRPVWPLERMVDHHRELVRDLEATGDLEHLRRHLADGLEAVCPAQAPDVRA